MKKPDMIPIRISLLAVVALASLFSQPTTTALAQDEGKLFFSADSLRSKGTIYLYGNWKYHAGDNAAWARPDFDDRSWETVDTGLYRNHLPKDGWKGIGWFRLHVAVDSALWHTPLALEMLNQGASEIHLNGSLLYTFGKVGTTKAEEEPYREYNPRVISFDRRIDHLVAVRYSNFAVSAFHERGKYAGFYIKLADLNKSIIERADTIRMTMYWYRVRISEQSSQSIRSKVATGFGAK